MEDAAKEEKSLRTIDLLLDFVIFALVLIVLLPIVIATRIWDEIQ